MELSVFLGFTVIQVCETNRLRDDCHFKDSLLLAVPKRRERASQRGATHGSTGPAKRKRDKGTSLVGG